MQFRRPSQNRVEINMAPLVDVVFLLVIFFAVSTTFLETSGLKLELPATTSTADRESHELTVLMGESGILSFEGEELDRDQLSVKLHAALENSEGKRVVLRADTSSRHGDVVSLIDLIREAGAESMRLAARPAAD